MRNISYFLIVIISLFGCGESSPHSNNGNNHSTHEWTDEQRAEFKTKCNQRETFKIAPFCFKGFESDEFDSVLVKEYKDTSLISSFKAFVFPSQGPDEKKRKERWGHIERTMNIHYTYQFIVPGHKPFVLANMKMVTGPAYTQGCENYMCEMADYTIDGVRFEDANPKFIK
jgi:hypothetical protein